MARFKEHVINSILENYIENLENGSVKFYPTDHETVLKWISEGNTPDPADPLPVGPTPPDFGNDDSQQDQLIDAVTTLRAYLALPTPTNNQTVGAFKLLIRVVLFLVRRTF